MSLQTDGALPVPKVERPRLEIVVAEAGLPETAPADALELPGELALVLRVALPLASHRRRLAAVGYAVEDMIAEPLEGSHVVLGPQLGPGEYLVVVVREAVMADWAPRAAAARLPLVPEVLGLPVPAAGRCSVRESRGRVLVRRADGTGYAASVAGFDAFWRADGAPAIVLHGGRLPEGIPAVTATPRAGGLLAGSRLDLLTGRYAARPVSFGALAWALAGVACLALVGHLAVLAADARALRAIAGEREALARAELARVRPDIPAAVPLDLALRRAGSGAVTGDAFLPLLSRVSAVMAPLAGQLSFRSLAYGEAGLAIEVEAADLGTLQRLEADLAAAGLAATAGAATMGDGVARARFDIGGGGT